MTAMTTMAPGALEFADLLVADDEWVEREFEALVAFGWDDVEPPTCPASPQGALRPRRPRGDAVLPPVRQGRGERSTATAWAHERGPPATPACSPAAS
ncbi:MAG: hypothetical protein QOF53_3098 [Nocardioidaceae bacterium]|jgi:hypothetical protein|nr:hypothetical protein [Nocardioidaceae bacterium]